MEKGSGDIEMIPYYDEETICGSCNKNIKKVNEIVCSECHRSISD